MYKLNEVYILSEGNKDKGKVTILNIVSKKHIKLKKRIHRISSKFHVEGFNN